MPAHRRFLLQSDEPSHHSNGAANLQFAGGLLINSAESAAQIKLDWLTNVLVVVLFMLSKPPARFYSQLSPWPV